MEPTGLDPATTVDEIMRRWPTTIRLFIRNRMLCIGCPIGIFHTVRDACDAHGLDEAAFMRELLAGIRMGRGELRSAFEALDSPVEDEGASVCGSRPPASGHADPSPSPSGDRCAPILDLPRRSAIG